MLKTANVTHLSITLQKLWQKHPSEKHPHMSIFKVCICFVADLQTGLKPFPPYQVFLEFCRQSKVFTHTGFYKLSYLKDDLQVSIKPGQLIAITWGQPIHEVLGVSQIRQPINWIVSTRVVATHLMLHHRVHPQSILAVSTRVEGTIAGICGRRVKGERGGLTVGRTSCQEHCFLGSCCK